MAVGRGSRCCRRLSPIVGASVATWNLLREKGAAPDQTIAITNARIFDRVIPRGTMVVRGREIVAVGAEVQVPAGAEVIDGAGATLLRTILAWHIAAALNQQPAAGTYCWAAAAVVVRFHASVVASTSDRVVKVASSS